MFNVLRLGIDETSDLIRKIKTASICLVTISFSLFFLILSIKYINMKYINCRDLERAETVSRIQCNEPSSNYSDTMVEFTEDSYLNFFPKVHDIETIDENSYILEPPRLVPFRSADCVDMELKIGNMTKKFKQMENTEKALKLFQHVLAQYPNHHDALLHYGEFLESIKDFINADYFYLKAIMLRPKNSRALANRKRTLPIVVQLDHEELKRIDSKRVDLIRLNKKDPNLKLLKKEIYIQYIHHTVALEGNTMNLDETQTVLETKLPVSGKSIRECNEILGVEAALYYMNQNLTNNNRDINMSDILEIHKRVLGLDNSLAAGTFRKIQVYVGEYKPPAASDVELLMEEFVKALRSPPVRNLHPIYIAAFVHHNLVFIHPFLDGNGRTARLLMNLIALKNGYPPIIIRKEEKNEYHKLLQTANESDHRPFYRFIARAAEYTIDVFLQTQEQSFESPNGVSDAIPLIL